MARVWVSARDCLRGYLKVRGWVKRRVRCWVHCFAKGFEMLGEMLFDTFDERFGIRLSDDSLAASYS